MAIVSARSRRVTLTAVIVMTLIVTGLAVGSLAAAVYFWLRHDPGQP